MMKILNSKKFFFTAFSILSVIGYGFVVFAAAPSGGYLPGQVLDPDCAPGDNDCIVTILNGGSQWDDVLGGINYAGGNVGIGTITPAEALDVVGTIQGTNLNITGSETTISAPTNISASFIYDNSYNYSAYSLPHNYRVYTYKDTVQGRIYSSSYLTLSLPSGSAPAAPTNLSANQTCADNCNYIADGSVTHNFRVYSYKIINNQRIYSTSYATLGSDFVDDSSFNNYDITVSWDPVVGADGYRILKYDPGYNGYNYDAGYDTTLTTFIDDGCGNLCFDGNKSSVTSASDIYDDNSGNQYGIQLSWDPVTGADGYRILKYDPAYNGYNYDAGYDTTVTSIIDDGCGSVCFDGGLIDVGQTTNYSNIATINGQLTLTGPIVLNGIILSSKNSNLGWNTSVAGITGTNNIFLGADSGFGAIDTSDANFIGTQAGYGATYTYNSNFIGTSAGYNATNASYSNFLGYNSGHSATNASYSNFFGMYAGYSATNANNANFLGQFAGQNATGANNSNFLGTSAGSGATSASYSNFLGYSAGSGATNAYNSNFIGRLAGQGATTAYVSNFIGSSAGASATNANNANFLGQFAGQNATNAYYSNFLGYSAGYGATNAYYSNFFGSSAGQGATSAAQSNFFGTNAGLNATSAAQSNFFGPLAGISASNAYLSNFFGSSTGHSATNASYSNFFGMYAGYSATNANNANFLGQFAGQNATGANNSNFLGTSAGSGATSASYSNFLGYSAGSGATNAYNSNFIGRLAGQGATTAYVSNFIGFGAGYLSTNAQQANFLGWSAGGEAPNTSFSNFMGREAGFSADNASNSNFLGAYAGRFADNASNSNFFGNRAGHGATGASNANFIGSNAGEGAASASNSTFIGKSAGNNDLVNNTGSPDDFSILIGNNTSTGGYSNSIALGGYATNTASNQFMIGSATRPIDTTRINGSASTQCTITTGTGIACTSDERVKTNIADLSSDTLTKLSNVKTVTYNWLQNPTSKTQIGFLAQDLEQYFPELVETDSMGMKSVYYAQMTPILVEAIREMNLNVTQIADMTRENTWRDVLISWFGNASNKITRIFTGELCLYDENGQTECINASELRALKQSQNIQTTPEVAPPTVDTPLEDTPPPTDESPTEEPSPDEPSIEEPPAVEPSPEVPPPTVDTPTVDTPPQTGTE